MKKPPPLAPGARLLVPSPAGPVRQPARWERLQQRVAERGYRLELAEGAREVRGYLAGADEQRARDLQTALDDPGVDAILCSRGGYGSMRLLPRLRVPDRVPPTFVGYSDITALHMWLAGHGWVTFHGPMATTELAAPRPHGPSLRWLWSLLEGTARPPLELPLPEPLALRAGRASGRLLGGNLTLLASLAGTPHLPSLRGALLVLEDVAEAPYRVDRMLTQLLLAGALDGVAGLAVGGFSWPGTAVPRRDEQRQDVLRVIGELGAELGVPVLAGLPCGHDRHNLALPLGVEAELDATAGRLVITEDWLAR